MRLAQAEEERQLMTEICQLVVETGGYSSDAEAFNPKEVSLLEELAGNIAFGIESLRPRASRMAAENVTAMADTSSWRKMIRSIRRWRLSS